MVKLSVLVAMLSLVGISDSFAQICTCEVSLPKGLSLSIRNYGRDRLDDLKRRDREGIAEKIGAPQYGGHFVIGY